MLNVDTNSIIHLYRVEELINFVWHREAVVAEEEVEAAVVEEEKQRPLLKKLLRKKRHLPPLIW